MKKHLSQENIFFIVFLERENRQVAEKSASRRFPN